MTVTHSRSEDRNWQRIQELFADAAERPPAERAVFLDRECADQPGLRAEVDSLLAAHDGAGDFLTDPALETMGKLPARDPIEGELVGPWRVLRLLGRGGMGAVYLAERADGEYERQVALKVVKRGMDTDAILGRFLRERQILAALDHPGIARFFDAGATNDGRPYFVMERIEGSSLIRYCDERKLDLRARLKLFCDVCRAVQYAHGNLVVHRDLKPSNILVTAEGRVKLLDFGIAKMLRGDGAAEPTTLTAEGMGPLTPEYAAPEQLRRAPVSTATDIYSLGAVLYQLVTGRTPFQFESRSPEEALRTIASGEPLQPSRVGPPDHRLRGDLDTIILTALRPEPERRYSTAAALLEDLQRYLTGYPIAARSDTRRYRTAKFIRRHKVGVLTALVMIGSLLASGIAVAFQQRQTARERDLAELRAAKLQDVADFLVGLFEGADPQRAPGTYSARELLDRGAQRLETDLHDQPLTRARLLETVASAYYQLRVLDESARLYAEATLLREKVQGPDHPELVPALLGLAATQLWSTHYAAAEQTLDRATTIAERHHDEHSPEIVRSLTLQANLHLARRSPAAAVPIYRRALAIEERKDPNSQRAAALLNNLGVALEQQGRIDEAEQLHSRALAIRRANLGHEHPAVAQSLLNLGRLAITRGEYALAKEKLNSSLAIREQALGADHTAVAEALTLRARARVQLGRTEAAESDLRRALEVRAARLGAHHPETANTAVELARLLAADGRRTEAVAFAHDALIALQGSADARRDDLHRAEALLAELR